MNSRETQQVIHKLYNVSFSNKLYFFIGQSFCIIVPLLSFSYTFCLYLYNTKTSCRVIYFILFHVNIPGFLVINPGKNTELSPSYAQFVHKGKKKARTLVLAFLISEAMVLRREFIPRKPARYCLSQGWFCTRNTGNARISSLSVSSSISGTRRSSGRSRI